MSTFISHSLLLLLLLLSTPFVSSDCTCDASDPEARTHEKALALKLKLVALFAILFIGAVGVCLPMLGHRFECLQADKSVFFLIKAFAGGVILATGLIHVLPDAFESLTSPCLDENPWGLFPFTGFIAMMAAIAAHMIDSSALSYYESLYSKMPPQLVADEEKSIAVHTHASHGHAHGGSAPSDSDHSTSRRSELIKHRVISHVLELGIVVHSVIIGISLGASESPDTIKPLIAALSFHQFFEGMGLGGCIYQAEFRKLPRVIMVLFFALTTPVGVGIGMLISNIYAESSRNALIVEGTLNAASAGILIYMSLVDLLAAAFSNPIVKKNFKLQVGANVFLLLGAGCMSLLAKWA
uniref:Uncharacterized protein n=1 Tax=Kalanchoe fedtschenkoi TaxID=63787 RepID=A0A7N0RJJ3_KALFE